jgi:hypothetical protein
MRRQAPLTTQLAMVVLTLGAVCAGRASAGMITSASASGPGGTVSNLTIDTANTTDDAVTFHADYTADAPIHFTLNISGAGTYFVGFTFGNVTNSTGSTFANFYAYLESGPSGSELDEASYNTSVFQSVTFVPDINPTEIIFNGPPGLADSDTTNIYVAFTTTQTGPATVMVALTPTPLATAAPEPATIVLGLTGAIGCLGFSTRRRRRLR